MQSATQTICFAPQFNSALRKDASGAFQPEAIAFAKFHGISDKKVFFLNNKLCRAIMRELVYDAIELHKPDNVAFFCHGWKTGIQLGFDLNFLDINPFSIKNPHIVLYACNTATGNDKNGTGGFADMLRKYLLKQGNSDCIIDAHFTAGHTTKNPNVRRFKNSDTGIDIVSAKDKIRFAKWRKLLAKTQFRFAFPFMSFDEINSVIDGTNENVYPII
jgi:hypothetical protein